MNSVSINIDQQFHGYRRGHQLLSSSCDVSREDQEVITYLSDLSGSLEPGQLFEPYITGYSVPSCGYYVIAKTWQDSDVNRSGCVFTRSFLIKMDHWFEVKNVARLVKELGSTIKPEIDNKKYIFDDLRLPIDPIDSLHIIDLAQLLFLQNEYPVVYYDSNQAEEIVTRAIQFDDSNFRQRLSFCTYSLAPRSINGVPLTLQFAPKVSRSKFSKWPGRVVGDAPDSALMDTNPELHALAKAAFLSSEPNFYLVDRSGLFTENTVNENVSIRIVVLWNRMLRESNNKPTAFLGLLDIASTMGALKARAHIIIEPLVADWISMQTIDITQNESIDIFSSLLTKIRHSRSEIWKNLQLGEVISMFFKQNPNATINKLVIDLEKSDWYFDIIVNAIVHSLAKVDRNEFHATPFHDIPDFFIYELVLRDQLTATILAESEIFNGSEAANSFSHFCDTLSGTATVALVKNIFSALWRKEQFPILDESLKYASDANIPDLIHRLYSNYRPIAKDIDSKLLSHSLVINNLEYILISLLRSTLSREALRFLISAIYSMPSSFDILLKDSKYSQDNLISIIHILLTNKNTSRLLDVLEYENNDVVAARIAKRISDVSRPTAMELLAKIRKPSDTSLQVAFSCVGSLSSDHTTVASFQALRFALQIDSKLATECLDKLCLDRLTHDQISELRFIRNEYSTHVIERNILFLANQLSNNSDVSFTNSKSVVTKLIGHGLDKFTPSLWKSMRSLLENISESSRVEYEEAASSVLAAALNISNVDVSELIEISFPIVHQSLKRKKTKSPLFLPFINTDWDKCKTAREELIRVYMNSKMPVSSLVNIAYSTDEMYSFFDIIKRRKGGKKYLKKIELSADMLPKRVRKEMERHQ